MPIETYQKQPGIAEVVIDHPPVNALDVAGWFALAEAVMAALYLDGGLEAARDVFLDLAPGEEQRLEGGCKIRIACIEPPRHQLLP